MGEQAICYLDNNATTRIAPEVVEVMLPYLRDYWGNPSSIYQFGRRVAKQVEAARERVAALVNAEPREIVFTSGGTESDNSAIHSALVTQPDKRHVLTTAVEHSAVLKFCESLRGRGYEVTFLPVDSNGALDLHLFEESIRPDTAIASVMWANNETGVLFPIEEIAAICRRQGVLFHTDAVQVPGRLSINTKALNVDFMSLSGHKLHAPKGVGALYVKRKTKYQPYLIGGGQERGRRGGTENVADIVGFGMAAELALKHLSDVKSRVRSLRDRLEEGVLSRVQGSMRNGRKEPRLVNTTNLSFDGVEAEGMLMLLDQAGICASSGSACTSGSLDPSHVLMAMGCSLERARGSIRFSLSAHNTEAEIDCVLDRFPEMISQLRAKSSQSHPGSVRTGRS